LENNTRDGLHIASLAGTWIALVAGFGGMRHRDCILEFAPKLPERLTRLAFSVEMRGRRLRVEISNHTATYTLVHGTPMEICHYGERFTVNSQEPRTRKVRRAAERPEPKQPPGCRPASRH
jgi:alpha,alpha-trehalose phosphorylase